MIHFYSRLVRVNYSRCLSTGLKTTMKRHGHDDMYSRSIKRLNALQSNKQTVALAKYNNPELILPLFEKQMKLAGITPEDLDQLNVIHIGGTKGKGSTCAFIESILRASGYKTGFYNSPHLVKVTERIRLNGSPIDDAKFSNYFEEVHDKLSRSIAVENMSMPTYFSFLTILAFHIFIEEKVDCVILEVGIGGEFDPTNIVRKPVVCGITTIDYDHTNILGKSIEKIAWTKSGISKFGIPLFTVEQHESDALATIEKRAKVIGTKVYICQPSMNSSDYKLGIEGYAQRTNAALACCISKYYLDVCNGSSLEWLNSKNMEIDIPELPELFKNALTDCKLPGRCQRIELSHATYFIDGAHTRKSMDNCIGWFQSKSIDSDDKIMRILMVNIIGDRDREDILYPLVTYQKFDYVLFAPNTIEPIQLNQSDSDLFAKMNLENVQRNMDAWSNLKIDNVPSEQKVYKFDYVSQCLNFVDQLHSNNSGKVIHVLVTGSLHFVGATLSALNRA